MSEAARHLRRSHLIYQSNPGRAGGKPKRRGKIENAQRSTQKDGPTQKPETGDVRAENHDDKHTSQTNTDISQNTTHNKQKNIRQRKTNVKTSNESSEMPNQNPSRSPDRTVNFPEIEARNKRSLTPTPRPDNSYDSSSSRNGLVLRKPQNLDNKAALDTVFYLRKKVKNFKKNQLTDCSEFDYPACVACLEDEILHVWRMPIESIQTSYDFLNIVQRKPLGEEVMESFEYADLVKIARRDRDFEDLLQEVRLKISRCLNQHVYKVCSTLKQELDGGHLDCVEEYESHISGYRKGIYSKRVEIEEEDKNFQELRGCFRDFVARGQEHSRSMNRLSDSLLELFRIVENWLKEDNDYPDKLTQEINSNNKKIEELKDEFEAVSRFIVRFNFVL